MVTLKNPYQIKNFLFKQTMTLPPELWEMIFIKRRKMMWMERKEKIHLRLETCLLPRCHRAGQFQFREYFVTHYNTPHLEITISSRHGVFTINHVLLICNFENNKHQTRFCYLPTHNIR